MKNKPFSDEDYCNMAKTAGTNKQVEVDGELAEKGILLTHKSSMFVTTKTNDFYKAKSVATRLFNLEKFLRETISRDLNDLPWLYY